MEKWATGAVGEWCIERIVYALIAVLCCSCAAESDDLRATPPADSTASTPSVASDGAQLFPDVIGAIASFDGTTWTFDVTISSPYDTPQRYADAWRVKGPDGTVFGERILSHDHQNEQPFTRSQSGIVIPDNIDVVTIEGRDLANGWGGVTFELTLPR
jgi:hypothetical protein